MWQEIKEMSKIFIEGLQDMFEITVSLFKFNEMFLDFNIIGKIIFFTGYIILLPLLLIIMLCLILMLLFMFVCSPFCVAGGYLIYSFIIKFLTKKK